MSAPYHGRCNCGAVTLRIDAEPVWIRQCWCMQCRKTAAGSPTNNALFATATMQLDGAITWFSYGAESGNTVSQGFCAECGTPVFGKNSSREGSYVVRLGFLDPDDDLRPQEIIWTDEAPDWGQVNPDIPQFPRQPPLPKVD